MNVSAWSIRQPIPSILLFAILLLAGLASFKSLRIQAFPNVTIPIVTITAALPGATPSQLENEVTRKIEDRVATIGAVNHISSTIQDGVSITTVDLDIEVNPQEALAEVRDAVSSVRKNLPPDMQEPVIQRLGVTGEPLFTYTIAAPGMDDRDLSWFVDDVVGKAILAVKGVESVTRQGGVEREVRVSLDPAKLQSLGVTAADVSLRLREVQQEASGGRMGLGGDEQVVRALATVPTAEALARLTIPLYDGRRVRLDEVATIRDTAADRTTAALLDGKPVTGFRVFASATASEVDVARGVRAAVERLVAEHRGLVITEFTNSVSRVEDSYKASMLALYEGAIFAVIVVFVFLRDWRATLVSATALPLSIIPTFALMAHLGYSLNTVTLLALTLVVGILVDDAIVEVENIVRHLRGGKRPLEAAIEAAQEIGVAVIATTLTLVAVFLPTAFMGGIAGQFFKQFGWTASVAVLASLLVARLLTPMMAAHLLRSHPEETPEGALMRRYLATMRWCLGHPGATLAAAAAFLAASLAMVALLPTSLMPAEDIGEITVSLETPPGNSIEHTLAVAEGVRAVAGELKEVKGVYALVEGNVRTATVLLKLVAKKDRSRSQEQVEADLRGRLDRIPGARFFIGTASSGGKFSLVLSGDDVDALQAASQAVVRELRTIPGLGNVTSSADLLRPEVHVTPDFAAAADLGVTAAAIGAAMRVATIGDYDVNLPKMNLSDRQIPIRVELAETARDRLETLRTLRLPGSRGPVPLASVARIEVGSGPAQITRFDRDRNVNIDVELGSLVLGDVSKKVDNLPALKQLPEGVRRATAGDAERLQEMVAGFGVALLAGILCVYGVLVLLFDDFLQPVTILAALPLAVGGALGFLMVLGFSLSMSAFIGLLMLMGIVTKNSILLVEYAIAARRDSGLDRTEAITDACRKRARPIVMTTCAMIAGMLPLALGLEGESSFRGPMAVVVIGGLLTSTVLSLLVIPVVYELVDDFERWARRRLGRGEAGTAAAPAP